MDWLCNTTKNYLLSQTKNRYFQKSSEHLPILSSIRGCSQTTFTSGGGEEVEKCQLLQGRKSKRRVVKKSQKLDNVSLWTIIQASSFITHCFRGYTLLGRAIKLRPFVYFLRSRVINYMTCYKFECSHSWNFF